jgi:CrcB protein
MIAGEVFNPVILIGIALAGGLGSIIRFAMSRWQGYLPWGILLANITASFFAGWAVIYFTNDNTWIAITVVGLAGGLSTFSSWAAASVQLVASGKLFRPALYTVLTLILSYTAAYFGLLLG